MSFINLNSQLPKNSSSCLYKGVVINNQDPLGLDRIQCRVPELYDDEIGEVPWILPIKYCLFGQGQGYGQFGVPPLGSVALIELQGNDPNFPVYRGFLLTDANKQERYTPGTYGIIDPNGSELCIDTNNQTLSYAHISGIQFILNADGTFNINVAKDHNIQVNGNSNITVNGSATVKAGSNIDFECAQFNVKAESAHFECPVFTGNLANTYGSGGTGATISGGIENTGGTISSNGIVLDTHRHSGVQVGSGNTGAPV